MAWSDAARRAAAETRRLRAKGKLMTTGMVRMGAVGRDDRYIMQQGMKKAQVRSWISGSGASKGDSRFAKFNRSWNANSRSAERLRMKKLVRRETLDLVRGKGKRDAHYTSYLPGGSNYRRKRT